MRTKTWLLLSVTLTVCVVAPSWAGVVVGIVNGLTDSPDPKALEVCILHTTKRWDGGTIDTTKGALSLEMRQSFAVEEVPEGKSLHVLLAIPSICRDSEVSLQLGESKLSPSRCSPPQVSALVDWLLEQKAGKSIQPGQVRFMRAPLAGELKAGDTISLELTCRIKPVRDGEALLFPIPQALHQLEPKPIGGLEYQIDVGPGKSVETPGHVDDVKVEENTPTEGWRRIRYSAENVSVEELQDFIVRIVR